MVQRTISIKNFLEPTSVALLVQGASKFKSRISLVVEEKTANAKSIMGIISLNMQEGQSLNIVAEGEDAAEAVAAMERFFG